MAIEYKIPELGENVAGGTVASVLVKKGDTIVKDQPIIELETEKAVLEVPADQGGLVQDILVQAGDEVTVGQTVIVLGSAGETPKATEPPVVPVETPKAEKETLPESRPQSPAGELIEISVPELGENVSGGTVANVLVAVGQTIAKDQSIVELETEKAVLEVPSTTSGVVVDVLVKTGDELTVGQVILRVESGAAAPQRQEAAPAKPQAATQPSPQPAPPPQPSKAQPAAAAADTSRPATAESDMSRMAEAASDRSRVPAAAAPSVRRFAREIGVDINSVVGTGPGARITIDDVKAFSKKMHQEPKTVTSATLSAAALPDFSKWGEVERQSMSKVRDKTAVHLSMAWQTIPHVTQFDKADVTELEKLRKKYGDRAQAAGGKLTMTAILLRVVASALKVFPQFNASVDMGSREIVYKKYIHIGIAVDTDRGLLVPVVRNVDQKNIIALSVELSDIAAKARDRKLTLEDMQGGNFTITNLGGLGGTAFAPIINAPEVAILGVSRGAFEPVYADGQFVPRLMLPLSLSYDHRVIDGADGVRFLRWIVEALEQP
ncbi:dihydrolipoyllysine-residue acetyltransferase, partial [candidate division KSB1 bacterium]|nr:dihydrolipoyllysine-residue acetyltransferase [candidate division KSB1 bacterium]